MITIEKISDIVNKIVHCYRPDKIILFGSYAKGHANEDSDLDLIIIKNTNLPKQRRKREIRKYLYGSFVPMDIKVYTPNEYDQDLSDPYSFLYGDIKDSKILYEIKD
ncbi:MAG: nucleotidyltransferase domain-containing protein [Bacteroidota bacterium]